MRRRLSLLGALSFATMGCQTTVPSDTNVSASDIAGTQWELVAYNSQPVSRYMVIRFDDGRVTGTVLCNSFEGSYVLTGDLLRFGQVTQTTLGCEFSQPEAVHEALPRIFSDSPVKLRWDAENLLVERGRDIFAFRPAD